jgi:hypothetical protein
MKRSCLLVASALWIGLAVASVPAQAAKAVKSSETKTVMVTSNVYGRPGLLFADTARITAMKKLSMSLHGILGSSDWGTSLDIPFGLSFGVAKNLELDASIGVQMWSPDGGDSTSGIGFVMGGLKYGIPGKVGRSPDVAVGGNLRFGPLSEDLGPDGVDIDAYGACSYTIASGLLLNGQFGILFTDGRGRDGDTVIHLNAGMGVPFSSTLTGMFELAMNEQYDGNSSINGGLLFGKKTKVKLFAGIGIDDGPDIIVGGGVTF